MNANEERPPRRWRSVVALSGGVGGARFLHGLDRELEPGVLTAVVNTGDDFEHWGLHVSPDLDTVMYTLADLAHEERGWGLKEESFGALAMMRNYGGDAWFALGDRDLATHLLRTQSLRAGATLSAVTERLCAALGIRARVVPMSDAPCRTMIDSAEHGTLAFQEWFVRHRAPAVKRVWFDAAPPPAPAVLAALQRAEIVLIGPSNPYVSIDPILALPGVREALRRRPVIAVSPILGGRAVKGPLAQMIPALAGRPASARAIAEHYGPLLAGFVHERDDAPELDGLKLARLGADTLMRDRSQARALAREVLRFAENCR